MRSWCGAAPVALLVALAPAGALLLVPAPAPLRCSAGTAPASRMCADEAPEHHHEQEGHSDGGSGRRGRDGGIIWPRVRQRVKELDESDVPLTEGIEVITEEIDLVIAARRKRLNAKLKSSLKRFRTEVTDEVSLQASEAKQRQDRLKERQSLIFDSLAALREDILEEIDASVSGVRRGGRTLEASLRGLRADWEREVNALIDGARQDVSLAVRDIEDVIKEQREEWQVSVELFEAQWLQPFGINATGADGAPLASRAARPQEVGARLPEIESLIGEISREVEGELTLFKQRWAVTKQKLERVPKQLGVASWEELPKVRSLAEVRQFVADSALAESGSALRRKPRPSDAADVPDPLGIRRTDDIADPVLRPTAASNLRTPGRRLNVITTAALPWMTGTSINPLLRAAHLARAGYATTLYLPFLADVEEQARLFPAGLRFDRPAQQEQYVRWWLETRANVADADALTIRWFPAEYKEFIGCILQRDGDIAALVPPEDRDVVILEEPEHINWYHHGERWTSAFEHVVGVAHTNYLQYSILNDEGWSSGELKAAFTELMNNVVIAAHTDVVVRLSATLPAVPGYDLVCNVHGVRAEFLAVGAAAAQKPPEEAFPRGAYFLGKALWTKGYRELLDHLEAHAAAGGAPPALDTYGSGKEQAEIRARVERGELPVRMNDGIDHAHPSLHGYRVFVNPSTSDVLCTATAEALAMGKKVLIPDHPSNAFFKQFANTLMYDEPAEMVPLLHAALQSPPQPLSPMEQYMLSWEAATERLLDAAALPEGTPRTNERPLHALAYYVHYLMGVQPVFDLFRTATGAGPVTKSREPP